MLLLSPPSTTRSDNLVKSASLRKFRFRLWIGSVRRNVSGSGLQRHERTLQRTAQNVARSNSCTFSTPADRGNEASDGFYDACGCEIFASLPESRLQVDVCVPVQEHVRNSHQVPQGSSGFLCVPLRSSGPLREPG